MVKKIVFFVFFLFVMTSFGQKKVVNMQTFDVILLSEVQKIEDCGTVYWHVKAKFKILTKRKQKSKIQDTVVFIYHAQMNMVLLFGIKTVHILLSIKNTMRKNIMTELLLL